MASIGSTAAIAALVADLSRMNMLTALMGGRALTASELARVAGITPQTASAHLARLAEAGLIVVERQGRHHYHRLMSPAIAQMLESIMHVAAGTALPAGRSVVTGPRDKALWLARMCYDHLAGSVAVAMADRMYERGYLTFSPEGGVVTRDGKRFLLELGVDTDPLHTRCNRGRMFCRPCLDWSERRPHIAGALGAALSLACFKHSWMRRTDDSRALEITPQGWFALRQSFGLECPP